MSHLELRLAGSALATLALVACGDDGATASDGCVGVTTPCTVIPAGASATVIQTAFIEAQPGDTIGFASGVYQIDNGLSVGVDRVTLKGTGKERDGGTVLSFEGATFGAEGLL